MFLGGYLFPAIYFPSLARTVTVGSPYIAARLYGWLPLSDAAGIISISEKANLLILSFESIYSMYEKLLSFIL